MVRIAILAEDLYDELELHYPKFRLREEGYDVDIIGPKKGTSYEGKHGYPVVSGFGASDVKADDYDALIIPGGYSPDQLRRDPETVAFVRDMCAKGKLIGAICHGGLVLKEAFDLSGKTMTCFLAITNELEEAGVKIVDKDVVVDGNLVTSRFAEDLPSFMKAFLDKLRELHPDE